eukprot:TRINITY_DN6877_c0_g1_i9.p1 TRINITY_DN6877_c0_g1~~TRINITY_DN6877_c0_g1_i9.p1  ORF type:complete len:558 (+),score=69.40 TRINITY_DN6877_c0_g1_i9:171-1844(+)
MKGKDGKHSLSDIVRISNQASVFVANLRSRLQHSRTLGRSELQKILDNLWTIKSVEHVRVHRRQLVVPFLTAFLSRRPSIKEITSKNIYRDANYGQIRENELVQIKHKLQVFVAHRPRMIHLVEKHILPASAMVTFASNWNGIKSPGATPMKKPVPLNGQKPALSAKSRIYQRSSELAPGHLYVWGVSKDCGIFGLSERAGMILSTPHIVRFPEAIRVLHVSCGQSHTLAVMEDNTLFSWGDNSFEKLGYPISNATFSPKPQRIEYLEGKKFIQVSAGYDHSVALTSDYVIYAWGRNLEGQLGYGDVKQFLPNAVTALRKYVALQVVCGAYHTMARTDEGLLFAWGANGDGQLGLGNDKNQKAPKLVKDLEGRVVNYISASASHSAAVTSLGHLYTWGNGFEGKLGHGDEEDCLIPKIVKQLEGYHVMAVSCGYQHTCAVLDNGQVYHWGETSIIHDSSRNPRDRYEPSRIPNIPRIRSLSCSRWFNALVHASSNSQELLTWCSPKASHPAASTARPVQGSFQHPLPVPVLSGMQILHISCGESHSACIVADKEEEP